MSAAPHLRLAGALDAARPLAGVSVAVTRPREDGRALADALRRLGAGVLETPLVRVRTRSDASVADRDLTAYDWIAFTSRYAVAALLATVAGGPVAVRRARDDTDRPRLAAVGASTAAALRAVDLRVDLTPEARADAEHLAAVMLRAGCGPGTRVLFPRAAGARETLPARLREAGASVDDLVLYDVVQCREGADRLVAAIASHGVDVVTLASGSAANALVELVGPSLAARAALVTIGPTTSAAVRAHGLSVAAEAAEPSVEALAAAVVHAV